MKKLASLTLRGLISWQSRSAVLMLLGSLSVSAAGQAKTEVTSNNHTSTIAAVTRAPLNEYKARLGVNENVETSRESPATLASTLSAELTQVYRVGVGDVLDVQLPQLSSNKSTLFTVLKGGVVEHPLIRDPVPVTGLTTDEIALLLRQQMKIFDNPTVVVNVRDYASHSVTVSGLVTNPGIKILRREAVPLYVIISQSIPPPEARRATIARPGHEPLTVDLENSKESSTLIIPGDVIKVSALPLGHSEFFFAGGEINSPGQKPYHSGLTLTQAILASGGLNKNAGPKVWVSRQAPDGRLVRVEYNLHNIQSGKTADPNLEKGDRVQVRVKG